MGKQITISKTDLSKALVALNRKGDSVYSARKSRGVIIIQFVGDREETRVTLPKGRVKKTTTEPIELGSIQVPRGAVIPKGAPAPQTEHEPDYPTITKK